MKQVLNDELTEGMILGQDIYDRSMVLFLSAGTILTNQHIRSLKNMDTAMIDIVERVMDDGTSKPLVIEDRLEVEYRKSVESFKTIFKQTRIGKKLVHEEIEACVEPLLREVEANNNIAKRLWQIENCDEYTYDHSVQVCMIASLLAKWLGYKANDLKEIAIAGLMHDIGKINIPDQILNKPEKLNEEEFKIMKTHSALGYVLLMNNKGFDENALMAVLQHHENYDGSGYPDGVKGKDINKFARIVTIADVYSAMISDRVYRKRKTPFEVARIVMDSTFGAFDPYYSMIFLNKISQFYVGNLVKLSNGEIGEVVMIPKNEPAKPLIKVEDRFIDLMKTMDIEIEEVIF